MVMVSASLYISLKMDIILIVVMLLQDSLNYSQNLTMNRVTPMGLLSTSSDLLYEKVLLTSGKVSQLIP